MAGSIPELKRRLVLSPDDAEARLSLGEALLAEGQAEEAGRQLERAAQLDSEAPGVWMLLAKALEQAKNPFGACQALREHLRRHPDDERGHESIAELLGMLGFLDEALLHAERAMGLSRGPAQVGAVLKAVELCQKKGLPERALLHLRRALRRFPEDKRLPTALRELYTDLGDEEALVRLGGQRPRRQLVEQAQAEAARPLLSGPLGDGNVGPAVQALRAGDLGRFRKALQGPAAPQSEAGEALLHFLRVELALLDGDLGQAERLLGKLLPLCEAPGGPLSDLLPAVLLRSGGLEKGRADYSRAAATFRRALRLRPGAAALYEELGDVLSLIGERTEAQHAYDAALSGARGELAEALGRKLAALGAAGDEDEDLLGDVGAQLRKAQRGPEVGRIHVLGVYLIIPGSKDEAQASREPVPLFGVCSELQAVTFAGRGEIACTGLVGPELLDEARAAAAFVKAQAGKLGLSGLAERDVHLHYVKPRHEGRSGGLAQVLAVVSAATGRPIRKGLAASGSITPLGDVHRVDGVREKLMAAYHAGVQTVMLPRACLRQVREVPSEVQDALEILYVDSALEACDKALLPLGAAP